MKNISRDHDLFEEDLDLTPRQEAFIIEYLKDFNGTQAAIRAGYSERTANEQAARLLANASIKKYLQKTRAKDAENAGITRENWLSELKSIGFADVTDAFDQCDSNDALSIKSFQDIKKGTKKAIKSIEQNKKFIGKDTEDDEAVAEIHTKITFHDKVKALDQIGKSLGFYPKDAAQVEVEILNNPLLDKLGLVATAAWGQTSHTADEPPGTEDQQLALDSNLDSTLAESDVDHEEMDEETI